MKYMLRSWVRRLFFAYSARTIRRFPALQLEALEDRTTPSFVGVKLIRDIANGSAASYPDHFTEVNGIVYFAATDASGDRELWRTDGTTAGTYRVADINNSGSSNPVNLTNVNGTLFFSADDGTHGRELWKFDGTTASMVKDIHNGGGSDPRWLVNVNGTLFFTADDGTSGRELWKSDGTEANTVLVKDIRAGASSDPRYLIHMNGMLFFSADDGGLGRELWRSDGTDTGTQMVKDINSTIQSSAPDWLTVVGGTLFFTAEDGSHGRELWKSDGTKEGTVLVEDILIGPSSSSPQNLTNVNGTLFFSANNGTHGRELWKWDGNTASMVKDIHATNGSYPAWLTPVNGLLFFVANDGTHGRELWISNGTSNGTVLVKDINSSGNAGIMYLTNVNGTLFFVADDDTHGIELWMSDGTTSGTVLVRDIRDGSGNSNPIRLTNANNTLFFAADDGSQGVELWRTVVATTLTITDGNNQSTTVGTAFSSPLVVQVLDQFDEPMEDVPVTFTAPASGASATFSNDSNTITVMTGSNGQASSSALSANTVAGSYQVQVTSGSLTPVHFDLTNTPAAAAGLQIVSGNHQSTTVGTPFSNPLVVRLVDQYGNGVGDASVTFTAPTGGPGALFGGINAITVTTDNNGYAQVLAQANVVAGSYQVTVTTGSHSLHFDLHNAAGSLAQVVFRLQPPLEVNAGQPFRVQVQLRDQYGNAVRLANVAVRIVLQSGSGLSGTLVKRTSIHGLATFGDLVLSTPGRYRLVARLGNGLQVISRVIVVS
jgi:ELWxxDGT repeat protein